MTTKKKSLRLSDGFKHEGGNVGVLLLHGLGGSPMTLRFLSQGLAREGYSVSAPFIPGLAGGSDIDGLSTWQDWYEAAETAFLELSQECDQVVVGGISSGAILALRLAQRHPEKVSGLTILAPTLWPNGWAIPWYFKFTVLIRQKWFANFFYLAKRLPYGIKDKRIRRLFLDMVASENQSVYDAIGVRGGKLIELRWMVRKVMSMIGSVKADALVMHSREDDMSNMSASLKIVRKLTGATEFVALTDSHHLITLDRQRDTVVRHVTAFVDRVCPLVAEQPVAFPAARATDARIHSGAAE